MRESCVVAVDMWEVGALLVKYELVCLKSSSLLQYENSNEFQYANGLEYTQSQQPSLDDPNVASENLEHEGVPVAALVAVGA